MLDCSCRYESFEYGLITQSYDVHVEQTLERNRDLVNSLPLPVSNAFTWITPCL